MKELDSLIKIAEEKYDGHFTLMKFTTNWRCCFGTIDETMVATSWMAKGKTMDEAIKNCIIADINAYDIARKMESSESMDRVFADVLNSL